MGEADAKDEGGRMKDETAPAAKGKRAKRKPPAPVPAPPLPPAASPPVAPVPTISLEERIARRLRGEGGGRSTPAQGENLEPSAEGHLAESPAEAKGLRCPACGCGHMPVLYTRQRFRGKIARVRRCRHCGKRTTTYEAAAGTRD
jgi:hypothetical protein